MGYSATQSISQLLGFTGRLAIRGSLYTIDLTVFIYQAVYHWCASRKLFKRETYRPLITQVIFTGIDALPLVVLLALAVGISFTTQMIHLTSDITGEAAIIETLTFLITFEIGPALTAIILIGRSGSAMAVDIGNMQLHREVEGLELLGIDIADYLIAPRLLGAAISQLVLSVYFSGIALYSGLIFGGMVYSTSYLSLIDTAAVALSPLFIVLFVIKNLIFGLIIGGAACYHGLQVQHSATEVPQQTQRAIVNSLALVFIIGAFMAFVRQ